MMHLGSDLACTEPVVLWALVLAAVQPSTVGCCPVVRSRSCKAPGVPVHVFRPVTS
jgi:hypothetical protein